MSREAFGDPPESQEPPDLCPVCGNDWHAEDCEFGKEVARRLKAERDAHRLAVEERTLRLRYGVVSDWIVRALKVLDTLDPDDSTEADELRKLIAAGEVLALTTLANSKTPNKPLRRGVDGVCTRNPGDLVLDPFSGSGTTAKAAKTLGRQFIGLEVNPEYCRIAEQRIAQEVLELV